MMSSTLLGPLAEGLNINAGSRSGGGGSQQADSVGFVFDAPNQTGERHRREGSPASENETTVLVTLNV